jgi:Flp pilus assembly protein TadG
MTRKQKYDRRGAATVELAFVAPVLVVLFLGMTEVGRAINATMILQDAAAVGAREASVGQSTNSQVQQDVLNYLTTAGIPTTNATVTVSNLTHSGLDASAANPLDNLQVQVTVPFKDVRWGVSGFIVSGTTNVYATSTYPSARVNPYPTDITVPQGF